MADIDDWAMPDGADLVHNPDAVIDTAIRDVLPPEFHDAECYWQFSSSAGFVTYFYVVKSEDRSGVQSAPSAKVSATTASSSCFSATNSAHVIAGRAHDEAFLAFANG